MDRDSTQNDLRLAACGLRRRNLPTVGRARRKARGATPAYRGPGFTLIEVLVVISILVILASITLMAVTRAKQTARVTSTQSFMNSVTTALNAFERDHGFYPPSHVDTTVTAYANSPFDEWRGAEILAQSLLGYLPKDTSSPPDPKIQDGVEGPGAKKLEQRSYQYATSGRNLGPYIETRSNDSLVETQQNFDDPDPSLRISYDPRRFYFTTAASSYNAPLLYIRKERGVGTDPPLWDASLTDTDGQYRLSHNAEDGSGDIFDSSNSAADIVSGVKLRPHALFEYWDATPAQGGPEEELNSGGSSYTPPRFPKREAFRRTLQSAKYILASPGLNEQFGVAGYDNDLSTVGDAEYDDIIVPGP